VSYTKPAGKKVNKVKQVTQLIAKLPASTDLHLLRHSVGIARTYRPRTIHAQAGDVALQLGPNLGDVDVVPCGLIHVVGLPLQLERHRTGDDGPLPRRGHEAEVAVLRTKLQRGLQHMHAAPEHDGHGARARRQQRGTADGLSHGTDRMGRASIAMLGVYGAVAEAVGAHMQHGLVRGCNPLCAPMAICPLAAPHRRCERLAAVAAQLKRIMYGLHACGAPQLALQFHCVIVRKRPNWTVDIFRDAAADAWVVDVVSGGTRGTTVSTGQASTES
jgi:hypothetical protein